MPNSSTSPLLETAADAVVGMDRAGRITGFNLAAETLFGQCRDGVLGQG